LPRAALGKGFAEGLRGFAESLGPSAKQPAPVVTGFDIDLSILTLLVDQKNFLVMVPWCSRSASVNHAKVVLDQQFHFAVDCSPFFSLCYCRIEGPNLLGHVGLFTRIS
jgi:hypothetical protein